MSDNTTPLIYQRSMWLWYQLGEGGTNTNGIVSLTTTHRYVFNKDYHRVDILSSFLSIIGLMRFLLDPILILYKGLGI